jgi:hypothetical protein
VDKEDQNKPTRRQWIGCLVVAVLFVAALLLVTTIAELLLGV